MILLSALLVGCPGGGVKEPPKDELIYVSDVNNYSYAATIALGTYPTAIGTDITFHWDNLTKDIQTHDIASCDEIDYLSLIWFQYLTIEELEAKIICGDIKQSDADVIEVQEPEEAEPSDCQAKMSETALLSNFFVPEKYYVYDYGVWFARVTTGSINTRMLLTLDPSAESSVTDVSFENDSSTLDFSVNLHDLTPVNVPAEALSYVIDWSTLLAGANADGCEPSEINAADQLWIARYDTLTVPDLEAQFLNLELVADEAWTVDAGARTNVDLAGAVSLTDGSSFVDFSGGGTWVLALRSTVAENPAPLFLTVLNVE